MSSDTPLPPPPPAPPRAPSSAAARYQAVEYAGFWTRLLAGLIDSAAYGTVAHVPVGAGVAILFAGPSHKVYCDHSYSTQCDFPDGTSLDSAIVFIIAGVLLALFLQARVMGRTGQTIGAKATGIRVQHMRTGLPIGFWPAVGRIIFRSFVSGWFCFLGFLWMLWDDRKQTWHDKVADSVVIKVNSQW
jgi:uncharacterized RDD family membrane protein YckC